MGATHGCPEAPVDLSQLPGAFPGTVYYLPTGDHTPIRDRHESQIESAAGGKRATRSYERVTAHENARMHLGDIITIYCQHDSSSTEETFSGSNTRQLRKALDFKNMHRRFDDIGRALLDTCQWVFDSLHYLHWQDASLHSEHCGFLWIKGKPGAGKSTLMKCAVNHTLETSEDGAIAYFFYDASGSLLQRSTEGMYRCLLSQMYVNEDYDPTSRSRFRLRICLLVAERAVRTWKLVHELM